MTGLVAFRVLGGEGLREQARWIPVREVRALTIEHNGGELVAYVHVDVPAELGPPAVVRVRYPVQRASRLETLQRWALEVLEVLELEAGS